MPNIRFTLWFAFARNPLSQLPGVAARLSAGAAADVDRAGGCRPHPKSLGHSLPTAPPAEHEQRQPRGARLGSRAAPAAAPPPPSRSRPNSAAPRAPRAESPGIVHVVTDVLDLDINLKGGEIDRADLPNIRCTRTRPMCRCGSRTRDPGTLYLLQTGLDRSAGEAAPTHLATLTSAQNCYTLPAGENELRVPLTWTDGHGLTVTKTFVFTRGCIASISITTCAMTATARAARLLRPDPAALGARRRARTSMSRPIRSRARRSSTAPNPTISRSRTTRTANSARPSPTAGSPRSSTISSRRSCRRRTSPMTTGCRSRATSIC